MDLWDDSDTPSTSGAVARHQVHEANTALDGITEFISVNHGTAGPWPHHPTRIGPHAEEGPSWLIDLTASGAHLIDDHHETSAELYGSASNLLLALHGRLPRTARHCTGDHAVLEHFLSWPALD